MGLQYGGKDRDGAAEATRDAVEQYPRTKSETDAAGETRERVCSASSDLPKTLSVAIIPLDFLAET